MADASAVIDGTAGVAPSVEAARRPIPGSNPCGQDVSYDDDYLAIKAEIDKLGIVGGRVDQERAAELRQMMDAARGTFTKSERVEAERLQAQSRGRDSSGRRSRVGKPAG